jgi:hypothetical protein
MYCERSDLMLKTPLPRVDGQLQENDINQPNCDERVAVLALY